MLLFLSSVAKDVATRGVIIILASKTTGLLSSKKFLNVQIARQMGHVECSESILVRYRQIKSPWRYSCRFGPRSSSASLLFTEQQIYDIKLARVST